MLLVPNFGKKVLFCVFSIEQKLLVQRTISSKKILNSNVVYKFICSRDVNVTYIGTSARHLGIRAGEHLNVSRSGKSAIKEHIRKCSLCKTQPSNMKQFKIIRKCQSSYEAKIHEALVIKRSGPVLNKQLYANGASFLPNSFDQRYLFHHLTKQFCTELYCNFNSFETIIYKTLNPINS